MKPAADSAHARNGHGHGCRKIEAACTTEVSIVNSAKCQQGCGGTITNKEKSGGYRTYISDTCSNLGYIPGIRSIRGVFIRNALFESSTAQPYLPCY